MDKSKRKAIEKLIYDTFNLLDKSGANAAKYKNLFSKMSDTQFEKHMKDFLYDDSQNFYLEVEAFKREPKMDDIKEAADYLGVPLFETVALPFVTMDKNNIVTTAVPVPVGYLHMKRVQQMIAKKNSMSIHIDKRQGKTGQVIGDDKNARVKYLPLMLEIA